MNRKLNTVVFILAGTLVNVLLCFVFILLFLFLVTRLAPVMGDNAASLVPFAFVAGIILAMLLYQKIANWVIQKYNLTEKLDPIFTNRRKFK